MPEIVGGIDVARQLWVATHDYLTTTGDGESQVAMERAGAVVEGEAECAGHGDDVGAVAVSIGDEGDRIRHHQASEAVSAWQVAMHDSNMCDSLLRELLDAAGHRCVETNSWMPQHHRASVAGPLGHVGVVACDEDGQLAGGGDNPVGGPTSKCVALVGCKDRREPQLGVSEGLHRYQHCAVLTALHARIVEGNVVGAAYAVRRE